MNKAVNTQSEIARAIDFSQGTVSKEFNRNKGKRAYRPKHAGENLYTNLRINSRRRSKKRVKVGHVGKIINRVDIEYRPKIVEERKHYGDWEVDLIEGSKGCDLLLNLYERKSRLGKLVYLKTKEARSTAEAMITELLNYKVKTITFDNSL